MPGNLRYRRDRRSRLSRKTATNPDDRHDRRERTVCRRLESAETWLENQRKMWLNPRNRNRRRARLIFGLKSRGGAADFPRFTVAAKASPEPQDHHPRGRDVVFGVDRSASVPRPAGRCRRLRNEKRPGAKPWPPVQSSSGAVYSTTPCGPDGPRPACGKCCCCCAEPARRRTSSSIAPKVCSCRWIVMPSAVRSRFAV